MATEIAVGSDRESQPEVDAVLAETGVTMDQVRRWRRDGLLPDVVQDQQAYRGSVVLYPKGTCAQIRAASALFKQKNRVDYVGVRLWRLGFPVDEKYWRPRLKRLGSWIDRIAFFLPRFIDRFDQLSDAAPTFSETAAIEIGKIDDIILSRIRGRVSAERLPAFVSVIEEVVRGDFVGFGHVVAGEEDISGRAAVADALDLQHSERDLILGRKLKLLQLLPTGLENVSKAIRMGHFAAIADAPAEEISKARGDAQNGLLIGLCLHEANRWIYGDGAFGLRFIAWIARKAPEPVIEAMTLLMFRLRQVPGAILPSDKIAKMAENARKVCLYSKRHEWHWRNHPSFSKILHPKRIKLAFADEIALKQWQHELNAIILAATAKTPTGSNNDAQEVGKSH